MKPRSAENYSKDALALGLRGLSTLLVITSVALHLASSGARRLAVSAGRSADHIRRR